MIRVSSRASNSSWTAAEGRSNGGQRGAPRAFDSRTDARDQGGDFLGFYSLGTANSVSVGVTCRQRHFLRFSRRLLRTLANTARSRRKIGDKEGHFSEGFRLALRSLPQKGRFQTFHRSAQRS